jgi:ABC-type glycerol-3-phosphate transport system substrate-binding protein
MKTLTKNLLAGAVLTAAASPIFAADLTVWDWKSGDPTTAAYYDSAKEAFEAANPGSSVKFVVQPHDQYYTLLGTALSSGQGPDVMLFNGGSQVQTRSAALVDLTAQAKGFSGTDAFEGDDGKVYSLPLTIQGFAVYYNKDHYKAAGLDADMAPKSYDDLINVCDAINKKDDVPCFVMGNKQGYGGEFFISQVATSTFNDSDYAAWSAGKLSWTNPKVKEIVELWVDGAQRGWYQKGVNSIPKFMDEYDTFSRGDAAHTVGLLSDVAHWKQFEDFLGTGNVGVFAFPNPSAELARLPFGGGIGWSVNAESDHQKEALSLVQILADADRSAIFAVDTGALVANNAVDASKLTSPALADALSIMSSAPGGSPHALLAPGVLEEWKRQSQSLLNGETSIEDAVKAMEAARKANM